MSYETKQKFANYIDEIKKLIYTKIQMRQYRGTVVAITKSKDEEVMCNDRNVNDFITYFLLTTIFLILTVIALVIVIITLLSK